MATSRAVSPGGVDDEPRVLHHPSGQPDDLRPGPDQQHAALGGRDAELQTGVRGDGPEGERAGRVGRRDEDRLDGALPDDLAANDG